MLTVTSSGGSAYNLYAAENGKMNLDSNDVVETGKGRSATITWPDKTLTRIGENTRVVIERQSSGANRNYQNISYDDKRNSRWREFLLFMLGHPSSYGLDPLTPGNIIVAGVRG